MAGGMTAGHGRAWMGRIASVAGILEGILKGDVLAVG